MSLFSFRSITILNTHTHERVSWRTMQYHCYDCVFLFTARGSIWLFYHINNIVNLVGRLKSMNSYIYACIQWLYCCIGCRCATGSITMNWSRPPINYILFAMIVSFVSILFYSFQIFVTYFRFFLLFNWRHIGLLPLLNDNNGRVISFPLLM